MEGEGLYTIEESGHRLLLSVWLGDKYVPALSLPKSNLYALSRIGDLFAYRDDGHICVIDLIKMALTKRHGFFIPCLDLQNTPCKRLAFPRQRNALYSHMTFRSDSARLIVHTKYVSRSGKHRHAFGIWDRGTDSFVISKPRKAKGGRRMCFVGEDLVVFYKYHEIRAVYHIRPDLTLHIRRKSFLVGKTSCNHNATLVATLNGSQVAIQGREVIRVPPNAVLHRLYFLSDQVIFMLIQSPTGPLLKIHDLAKNMEFYSGIWSDDLCVIVGYPAQKLSDTSAWADDMWMNRVSQPGGGWGPVLTLVKPDARIKWRDFYLKRSRMLDMTVTIVDPIVNKVIFTLE